MKHKWGGVRSRVDIFIVQTQLLILILAYFQTECSALFSKSSNVQIVSGTEEVDPNNLLYEHTSCLKKGIQKSPKHEAESQSQHKINIFDSELQANSGFCGIFNGGKSQFIEFEASSFAYLRKQYGIKESDFLNSFAEQREFLEFQSNSKSRQSFFFSHDGRYMIKTQKASETQALIDILPELRKHMEQNPDSLINRFCGLYSVKTSVCSRPVYFVVIENIMFTPLTLQKKYDLKGSSVGRTASIKESAKSCPVLKDNDLKNAETKIKLGKKSKRKLLRILERDVAFLNSMNLMDYSILLGIHHSSSSEGRRRSLPLQKVFQAPVRCLWNKFLMTKPSKVHHARFCSGNNQILFLGIIDILQRYNTRKYLETWLKSCIYAKEELSPVPPSFYSQRMVAFVNQHFC
mmetsp:Transcript_20458/g.25839  ORF Transcript_20458/g.25839 Transcript_20458/m.25839 type:complete len:405 (-) Transcript_20458:111-1325(-)